VVLLALWRALGVIELRQGAQPMMTIRLTLNFMLAAEVSRERVSAKIRQTAQDAA
jgi:hypothetical protein